MTSHPKQQLTALLLCISATFGNLACAESVKLNLPDLENMMFTQSPALRSATNAVDAARAAVDTARTIPNPQIEVMNGTRKPRPGYTDTHANANLKSISLTQDLDMPWHRFPRVDGALAGLSAAQANEQSFRADMRAQLRLRYYDLVRRTAENRVAREDVKLMEGIHKRIELQVETGEKAKFELVKANAELLNAQKMQESATLRVRQSRGALRALVGVTLPEAFEVQEQTHTFAPPAPLNEVRDAVLKTNPELQRTRAERQQLDRKLSEEKSLRFPKFALRADQDNDPEWRSKRVGVAMNLPLWDWRGGPVGEAAAKLSQTDNQLAYQEFSLLQSLEAAYQQYDIANAQVVALEGGIVRHAANALRIAELAYKAGEKSFLDVMDAQRVYRAARNELITAQFELASAWAEIERLRANT
ncbi:TolC family protein [Limnohabitans sp. TEGF004]|uniref:TolC family protein n=1 Tax=Limnohabitans sp. TEGF004 TaxID=2986281 RepID=UPI00249061E2|nr:TolC family protein [Limnohabitans sp. TEGF004]